MKNLLFSGLSSLLLPMAAYAGTTTGASYQRTYLSSTINSSTADLLHAQTALPRDLVDLSGDQLDIQSAHHIRELVIVDGGVADADKAVLRRALKPGVQMVELDSASAGLPQLIKALDGHKNLAAIHVVSHAEAGAILLGNSRITAENIQRELHAFAALSGAVREGGDLLFYGCQLAANKAGEELLDIISNKTGLDVAASNNLTGNPALDGDWELEVKRGNIESRVAFSEKSLKDFSSVLVASSGTKNFASGGWTDNNSNLTSTDFIVTGFDSGGSPISNLSFDVPSPYTDVAYLQTGYNTSTTGTYFHVAADGTNTGSFELTGLVAGEYGAGQFNNVHIIGIRPDNSTITSGTINGTGSAGETFTFGVGQLSSFSGVKLKAFKLVFDSSSGSATKPFFEFRNFTITGALAPLPVVSDSRISITGATGTGSAYKIGDTVTATWNNTAGGDNNTGITGVTVDFSQFGGGSAVAASNSSNTWTAFYTITSGSIDLPSRNVSVTATNANGSNTPTADTTNATVDNIAPTVTDGRISISGASGTAGAYKIGDVVTATWNNTNSGDNNTDTINSVSVNFTQFGGGAAVAATNSSDTWTATYTIVSGVIDATNRNVTVTATDNAGNATSTADTTNATVDNNPPSVSSIAVSGSPLTTDTSMAFTVTFDEAVVNVSTDDFTLVGAGATGTTASVSASSGSSVDVNIASISGNGTIKINLNGSTNIVDDAGNSIPSYSSGSTHTVAIPTAPGTPTIGTATAGDGQATVTFTAPGSNGGSAITTYTATANPGGATGTCAGPTACVITVGSLTNGLAYTFSVTATNGVGTGSASGASNSVTPMANQIITFTQPANYNFGATPTLTASSDYALGGATGFTIDFTSSTTSVCTITSGGALTFVSAGTCTIGADQAGNSSTNAASTVTRSFTVNAVVPDAPTIGTATAGDQQATVTFTAPSNSGGASITGYTVTANPGNYVGTGSGSPITVTGLTNGVSYTFTVTATNSAGTGAASLASNSVVPAAPQTITFANPGSQNFGTTPDLRILNGGASATSGLSVTFTSSTTGVCTVTSEGVLTFLTVGTCTINADQAGDSSYLAATQITRSFTVNAVVAGAPTSVVATAGDNQASVAFAAPTNTGGTTITGYTVTVSPADVAPVNGAGSPIVITGLTNGQPYTFTVTADNSAGTGPASSSSNSVTPAATQTITFNNPGSQSFGTTPTFTATSDSGLNPTFTSSTTGVCTITTGGLVTFVTTGTCTINADQAGNGSYLPATQVTRSFTVNAVLPGAPTIGSATAGDAQASVSFTAPTFTGGAAITNYTVTANPGGATASGSGSPITITGLSNGTSYDFTVTATNSAGTGSASAASNTVVPNGAPLISGTPAITVAEDAAYSFTPTANDSVGDVLTFSITNKPGWASFNTATGALTGTPTNADVGTTTGILISVSDGSLSASLAAFNLVVTNVNDAPLISGTPATTVAQDTAYSFTPTASDDDVGDVLTYSIINAPTWASFDTATGALTGTPANADVGTTTGIIISVSDGTLSASLAAFDLTVTNVNDAPTITGTPTTSVAQDAAYSFTPTGNDDDSGTTLTYSITNAPTWASFDTATGALTGTPANADVGTTTGIIISVSDGTLSASLAAFDLTVTNVNDAPTITGTPTTSVAQDAAYSFTPTGNDDDSGTTLTYSITNAPTWASFDTATGVLTGTPANADVGTTTGIIISVSDGTLSASLAAFDLTVTNVNDAPAITGTPTTSVAQDATYNFTPTGSDDDTGTTLTYSITNAPTWASFDTATGALTGTPANADVGTTTGIIISVSDGTLSASLAAFDITVTNVNEAPVISGTPLTSVDQDVAYSFTPTASDEDLGDVLTFSISNKPGWATFNTATGALTGTPAGTDTGKTLGIVISVSDGTTTAALPAFDLEVMATIDPLQPIVTPPASLELNATALFTPVTLKQLLGLNPNATQTEVDQLLTSMASDGVSGNSCCVAAVEGLSGNVILVRPGRHILKWKATNGAGVTGEASQIVDVKPLVSLSKSQIAIRGSNVEFRVLLNGPSPVYPLSIPYVVDASSTATAQEHNLVNGVATFTQPGQVEAVVPVSLAAVTGFSDSQLVVTLGSGVNAGVSNRHVIDIRQGNVPPVVMLTITQGGINTSLVTPNGGPVTVTATVTDLNPGDTHSFDWSATTGLADTDGDPINATRVFDPAGLTGSRPVNVTVTDSAGASVRASAYFRVVSTLPALSPSADTDEDGLTDDLEGTGDTDDNGIPDYLDNMPSSNILPQQGSTTNAYLIECDPGVRCGLGLFARTSTSGGVQILDDEVGAIPDLSSDSTFEPVGGIFDFAIRDLPTPGQAVRVVVPQRAAIPANAVYRKFQRGAWISFVIDADNTIHSAPGNPGYCPPPGTSDWTPGLTAGHLCVQLTIKDGGPNDDDGLVNSAVVDPGVVSVEIEQPEPPQPPPPPPPPKPPVEIKSTGGGGSIQAVWLLLLGALVMIKKTSAKNRMVKVLLAALGLAAMSGQAADGFYVRADVSNVSGSMIEEDFVSALANYSFTVSRYDINRTGYQIAVGYQWDQHASTEIGYLDLGEVKVNLALAGETDLDGFSWDFSQHYPISAEGISLVQGLTLNPAHDLKVIGEVGLYIWRSKVDVEQDPITLKKNEGEDPIVGLRLELPIGEQIGLGMGIRRVYFDTQEVDLMSVTGVFRF